MGVIYKLKSEIREFILKEAKAYPELGCRKLTISIREHFQATVSKSSINSVLKSQGMSMPVGRRRKKPWRTLPEAKVLGVRFLLEDNSFFFMDASGCSLWPNQRIPAGLGVDNSKIRQYLRDSFISPNKPLVLLSLPGSSEPPPECRDFIAAFGAINPAKLIKGIELYNPDGELVETLPLVAGGGCSFIAALWPWQYHNDSIISPLRAISCNDNQRLGLTLVTNLPLSAKTDHEVILLYLERWSQPELSYKEFLEKVIS